jgi:glycosyltransferase involved in cell wall biosynthesis
MSRIGAVVIGRNEGSKLARCLASVLGKVEPIIYVDSGSGDGSAELARRLGAHVVQLDPSRPFTVGRAKNEGFDEILRLDPNLEFVQFVDADSEIVGLWLGVAEAALRERADACGAFGRLQERYPRKSVFNRLYAAQWHLESEGNNLLPGMSMMRVSAFRSTGGFVEDVPCVDDRELSIRLVKEGWKIVRLDTEMAIHDTGMMNLRQWWNRKIEAGYALAYQAWRHSLSPTSFPGRSYWSSWFWGLGLPLAAVAGAWPSAGASLLLLLGYPVLFCRVHRWTCRGGVHGPDAILYAAACTIDKFPKALGQIRFHLRTSLP